MNEDISITTPTTLQYSQTVIPCPVVSEMESNSFLYNNYVIPGYIQTSQYLRKRLGNLLRGLGRRD